MKHRNWIGCSRSCRKMTWKHLGFIICYTGILIVVIVIKDRYDAERLGTNGELKGYKFDEIDTVTIMTKTHDIQMHNFDQQAKQTNRLDNQMHSFEQQAIQTNRLDNQMHSFEQQGKPAYELDKQMYNFGQQAKQTNGLDNQMNSFDQQAKPTKELDSQMHGFDQQAKQTHGLDNQMHNFAKLAKQTNGRDNHRHSFDKLSKQTNNQIHSSDHQYAQTDNSYPDVRATSKSGFAILPKTASNSLMTHFQQEVRTFRKPTVTAKGGPWTMDRFQEWFTITDESTKDPMLNKHQYILHQTSKVCNRKIDLLIVVHSTVNNFDRRRDIRLHWGSVHHFKNISIGTVFLLGESRDTHVNMKAAAEASANGDIVQGNFTDSYTNLTYKHVMALHWMTSQCNDVRTIVKVDDDVVIDIFKLAYFSKSVGHYENTLYCSMFRRIPAIRDPRDKWYTPYDMYPFDLYPDYCEGFGYIMSIAEARLMYKASEETRFYWVDDVYITGILRLRAGINIRGYTAQHSYTKMNRITDSTEKDVMFYINYDEWQDVWHKIYSQKYRY